MKWITIATAILLFGACKKESDTAPVQASEPTEPITYPARMQGPFGIMSEGIADTSRIKVVKQLGISNVRAGLKIENFTRPDSYTDTLISNNYHIIADFNYYGSEPSAPFPTDQTAIAANISNVLKTFHPALAAIENEEINENFHVGPAQDYINELTTATKVLHASSIKVTNGGITEDVLCILVYRDYLNRGLTLQANDFASRTMPQTIITDLPALANHPGLANRVSYADTLLQAYKNMSFDYINFHWYEPVIERWTDAPQTSQNATGVNTQAIGEAIAYLQSATGKQVITNETGELNSSPGIVKNMLQQYVTSRLPYVIWYSGNGTGGGGITKAVSLSNTDGTLRSNGIEFRNFIQTN